MKPVPIVQRSRCPGVDLDQLDIGDIVLIEAIVADGVTQLSVPIVEVLRPDEWLVGRPAHPLVLRINASHVIRFSRRMHRQLDGDPFFGPLEKTLREKGTPASFWTPHRRAETGTGSPAGGIAFSSRKSQALGRPSFDQRDYLNPFRPPDEPV